MRKYLVLGSVLVVFLLMMVPIGSSVQYQQIKQVNTIEIENNIEFTIKNLKIDLLLILLIRSLKQNIQAHLNKNVVNIDDLPGNDLNVLNQKSENIEQFILGKICKLVTDNTTPIVCLLLYVISLIFYFIGSFIHFIAFLFYDPLFGSGFLSYFSTIIGFAFIFIGSYIWDIALDSGCEVPMTDSLCNNRKC